MECGKLSVRARIGFQLMHMLLALSRRVQEWTFRELDRLRKEEKHRG